MQGQLHLFQKNGFQIEGFCVRFNHLRLVLMLVLMNLNTPTTFEGEIHAAASVNGRDWNNRARMVMVFLLLITTTTACGSDEDGSTGTDTPASPTLQPTTQDPPSVDEFTELLSAATDELDQMWREAFGSLTIEGVGGYEPPEVISYRAGDLPDTVCARSGGPAGWVRAARYCPADQRIVYDEDWFREMARADGDLAPITVLAHEWGHHVQSLLGGVENSLPFELQADCLAGLYLASGELLPDESSGIEEDWLSVGLTTFFNLGNVNYRESEWFAAGEHGSSHQRVTAVSTGMLGNQVILEQKGSMVSGLPFCYGYRDYVPSDFVEIGPYRFLEPPGLTTMLDGIVYRVEPETRTGQAGSTVIMSWIEHLAGGATMAQLEELWTMDTYLGLRPISDPIPLDNNMSPGTGVAHYFELVPSSDTQTLQSGYFALLSPSSGNGGLLLLVVRPAAAPLSFEGEDVAVFQEQALTLFQVINRLCSPDESDDPSASNLNPICMAVQ